MGYVMDHIYSTLPDRNTWIAETIADMLESLREHCAWTEGFWDFGDFGRRPWNDLQNIDRDIRLLANHLLRLLKNNQAP